MSNTVPGGETGPNGPPENEEQRSRLHAATCRATGVRNAAEAELVALIARVDAEEMWAADDARSIEHWIMWRLGVTRQRAHQYLTIARRREELPHAHGLYDQGRLSTDQMLILTRHCSVGYDRDMAKFATYATIPQLSRSLRRYEVDEPLDGNAGASGDEGAANPGPSLDPDLVGGLADFHVNEDGFRLLLRGSQADGLRIQAAIEQAKAWLDDDCNRDAASRIYDAVSFLITQGAARTRPRTAVTGLVYSSISMSTSGTVGGTTCISVTRWIPTP